ncbi:MAG: sensor domain-containing diguanylate cyclase [Nitrospirae bacterium]|nr:sensor domain-containing diguanylate cyclase [Nitrospirota bacterium]
MCSMFFILVGVCVLAVVGVAVLSYRRGRLSGRSEQKGANKERLKALQDEIILKKRQIDVFQTQIRGLGDAKQLHIRKREILEDKLRQKGREIALLSEASLFLTTGDFQKTCNLLAYRAGILPHVKFARLYLLDEESTKLRLASAYNISEKYIDMIKGDFEFPIGNIPAGTAVVNRMPLLVDDVYSDEYFSQWRQITALYDYRSYAAVPLLRSDRILGVLEIFFEKENIFGKDFLDIVNIIANVGALAVENALFTEKLHGMSIMDEVTGAYNRRFMINTFDAEIERAARHGHFLSFVMFDLDNFKTINDTLGHLKGDEVLRSVAGIMREVVRATDYVCRYGGDEFAILLPETGRKDAVGVIKKMRKATVSLWAGLPPGTGMSIGFSVYPEDGSTSEDLIRHADNLVYEEKHSGKGRRFPVAVPLLLS